MCWIHWTPESFYFLKLVLATALRTNHQCWRICIGRSPLAIFQLWPPLHWESVGEKLKKEHVALSFTFFFVFLINHLLDSSSLYNCIIPTTVLSKHIVSKTDKCAYMNVFFVFLTEKTWIKFKYNSQVTKQFLRAKITFSIFCHHVSFWSILLCRRLHFLCVKPEDGFWKTPTTEKHQP